MRLSELQHAAVFAELGDEGEEGEEQPVSSFLLLLLGDLQDKKIHHRQCRGSRRQRTMKSTMMDVRLHSCPGVSLSPGGAAGLRGGGRSSPALPPRTGRRPERQAAAGWSKRKKGHVVNAEK